MALNPKIMIAGRCAETVYRQRRLLAQAAKSAGWEVTTSGDYMPGPYIDDLAADGTPFQSLNVNQSSQNPADIARLTNQYRRILRSTRPHIFHAFNIKPTISGLIGARLAGVPVRVATVAGLGHAFLSDSRVTRIAAKLLFKLAFMSADNVIFYNQDDRDRFIRERLLPARKAIIIKGSGVDTSRFHPTPLPNGERLKLLFIGRLLKEKGIVELLDAAKILHDKGTETSISIVGDTDPNNPSSITKDEILTATEQGHVRWLGSQSNVASIIADNDVVVLPSHREGIPLALLEGGASGRALITCDAAGCRDVVDDGVNGILVPVGDAAALAQAIETLASDRNRMQEMGANARRKIVAEFDTAAVNGQMLDLYRELLTNAAG